MVVSVQYFNCFSYCVFVDGLEVGSWGILCFVELRTQFLGVILHEIVLCDALANEHRTALLNDLHFLNENFVQRRAQKLSVVIAHIGDDGEQVSLNQVGGIQSAPDSYLETTGVHLLLLEEHHAHDCEDFEKRALHLLLIDLLEDLVEEVLDELSVDELGVDLDPLSEGGQVRRNEESGFQAIVLEYLGELVAHGALAIGAGYMDEIKVFVGIAEIFGYFLHIIQIVFVGNHPRHIVELDQSHFVGEQVESMKAFKDHL